MQYSQPHVDVFYKAKYDMEQELRQLQREHAREIEKAAGVSESIVLP